MYNVKYDSDRGVVYFLTFSECSDLTYNSAKTNWKYDLDNLRDAEYKQDYTCGKSSCKDVLNVCTVGI